MTTPLTPDQLAEQAEGHNCQIPECPNLFDLMIHQVADGSSRWLCWPCALPFLSTLVSGMVEMLTPAAAAADGELAAASDAQEAANLAESHDAIAADAPPPPAESAADILARYRQPAPPAGA